MKKTRRALFRRRHFQDHVIVLCPPRALFEWQAFGNGVFGPGFQDGAIERAPSTVTVIALRKVASRVRPVGSGRCRATCTARETGGNRTCVAIRSTLIEQSAEQGDIKSLQLTHCLK
jgi:hypothetical protein